MSKSTPMISICFFALVAFGSERGSNANESGRKPDFSITAEDLAKEFHDDATKASDKYKGKTLEVTGHVDGVVTSSSADSASLYLKGSKDGPLIRAVLQPELRPKAFLMSLGQKVKVTGEFQSGSKTAVSVETRTVEELSKSELRLIRAEDLAKEFAKDKVATEKKFAAHVGIVVSGEVEDITSVTDKFGATFSFAKLKGNGDIRVSITMQAGEANRLKKGAPTRIRTELQFPPELNGKEVTLQGGYLID